MPKLLIILPQTGFDPTEVALPWLGSAVLYAEEFTYDEPEDVRRQALLVLSDVVASGEALRVQWYGFRDPAKWRHLQRSSRLRSLLTMADLDAAPGCDLLLARDGQWFVGSTQGKQCRGDDPQHYVELKLAVGEGQFWSQRRIHDRANDELVEDQATFTYASIDDAQLFLCQVFARDSWQAHASLELHDQGGRQRFRGPDGKDWELILYGRDWPTAQGNGALQLTLVEQHTGEQYASGWAAGPRREVQLDADGFRVSCAPVVAVDEQVPL